MRDHYWMSFFVIILIFQITIEQNTNNCWIDYCQYCENPGSDNQECITCEEGFYLQDQYCEYCPDNCMQCSSYQNCSQCSSGYLLVNNSCTGCLANYSLIGDDCILCNISNCNNCYSINYCINCSANYSLVNGSCIQCNIYNCISCLSYNNCYQCLDSYMPNANGTQCITCSISNCINCSSTNYCQNCQIGYFEANGTCLQCNNGCKSCSSNQSCNICLTSYTFNYNTGQCVLCNISNCVSCQQANNCSTCNSSYSLANNQCLQCNISNCNYCLNPNICYQCNSNYFLSSNGTSCSLCNVLNCMLCSSQNLCEVCYSGYQLNQLNRSQCFLCNLSNCNVCSTQPNTCLICSLGYSLINGSCVYCSYPCSTCDQNGDCLTCSQPYYQSQPQQGMCLPATVSNCFKYNSSNPQICTNCSSQYILHQQTNQCVLMCGQSCQKCNESNNCIDCAQGYYSSNGVCISCQINGCNSCNSLICLQCLPSFYLSQQGGCLPCPGYCLYCTSPKNCTQLVQSQQQILVTQNQQTYLAVCSQGCISCLSNNTSICSQCYDGLYLSNGLCYPCSSNCKACSISNPFQCLSCFSNSFLINNTCYSCTNNCQTCSNQNNLSFCTSCFPGYLLNNGNCIQRCPSNCLICQSSNSCTLCNVGYTLMQLSSSQFICIQCASNCRICAQGIPYQCLQCGDGFYLANNSCQACSMYCQTCNQNGCQTCIQGYFINSQLLCSVNCQAPCATCSSGNPSLCNSCIVGYTLQLSACIPQLNCVDNCPFSPFGYILINGYYYQCNVTNCQICNYQNLNYCLICGAGYYSNNGICINCPSQCTTCINGNGCLTCASGYISLYLIDIQANGYQCIKCNSPCATCIKTPDYCTSCINGYSFQGWKCINNFYFGFDLTLLTDQNTFKQNYNNLIQYLSNAIGQTNSNIITITQITFGSVKIQGQVSPNYSSGSPQANNQFNSFLKALSSSNSIAGMNIGSSTVSVNGGSLQSNSSSDEQNLKLILAISIPCGAVLIILIIITICCCKKKRNNQTNDLSKIQKQLELKIHNNAKNGLRKQFKKDFDQIYSLSNPSNNTYNNGNSQKGFVHQLIHQVQEGVIEGAKEGAKEGVKDFVDQQADNAKQYVRGQAQGILQQGFSAIGNQITSLFS